jgi:hypothetical protein
MTMNQVGIWVGAIMTLAMFSLALYKDNAIFQVCQHAYLGVAAAYGFGVQYDSMIKPVIVTRILKNGEWRLVIPIMLALCIYLRFYKPLAYLSRNTVAFMVGIGSAVVLTKDFKALVLTQLVDTMRVYKGATALNNVVVAIGVLATLFYFIFTVQHKGVAGRIAWVGRLVMLLAFGASFGNTVMARISLLLGRLQFLLGDWLGLM